MQSKKKNWLKRFFIHDIRKDGMLLQDLDIVSKVFPYLQTSRTGSSVILKETFNITSTINYIDKYNNDSDNSKLTLFIVLIAAIVRTSALHPKLIRFVVGKNIYARNNIQVSFVINKDMNEDSKEFVVKITFNPTDTLQVIAAKINQSIAEVRQNYAVESDNLLSSIMKLPSFMISLVFYTEKILNNWGLAPSSIIKADPLYSSVMIANLGSLGLSGPYHHLYERGTISLFIVLGKHRNEQPTEQNGTIAKKQLVDVTLTYDDRIASGLSASRAFSCLKNHFENPELLSSPPVEVVVDK